MKHTLGNKNEIRFGQKTTGENVRPACKEDNIKRNLREVEMKEKAVFVFNYAPHHEDVVVK
jgi:hypothetical protein